MAKCDICGRDNASKEITFDNGRVMVLCDKCVSHQTIRKIIKINDFSELESMAKLFKSWGYKHNIIELATDDDFEEEI